MLKRNIKKLLEKVVLEYNKMAFISGPRQAGKTTLAEDFQKSFEQSGYLNWDVISDQKTIVKDPYFFEKLDRNPNKPFLLILDEIHKYAKWKGYLKGCFDKYHEGFRFVVTGSGRLDLFKKGGDSLLGRYFGVPLFPLSLGELSEKLPSFEEFCENTKNFHPQNGNRKNYQQLFSFSGFPEPFLKADQNFYNLWFSERKKLLIREDIRDASKIREISLLETLSHLIPDKIGSPLSINSLREDVGVAFETVREWVGLLAQFYYLFQISPFTRSIARTLKKEPKVYLFDWVEVVDEGARFENMVALHLYKAVNIWQAMGEGKIKLHYLRDKEKREVDFVIAKNEKPVLLVECKSNDSSPSANLIYFQEKLNLPVCFQLVHREGVLRKIKVKSGDLYIVSADQWLNLLP